MDLFHIVLLFLELALVFSIVYIPYKIMNGAIRGMVKTAKKTWHAITN